MIWNCFWADLEVLDYALVTNIHIYEGYITLIYQAIIIMRMVGMVEFRIINSSL